MRCKPAFLIVFPCAVGLAAGAAVFPIVALELLKYASLAKGLVMEGVDDAFALRFAVAGGALGAVAGLRRAWLLARLRTLRDDRAALSRELVEMRTLFGALAKNIFRSAGEARESARLVVLDEEGARKRQLELAENGFEKSLERINAAGRFLAADGEQGGLRLADAPVLDVVAKRLEAFQEMARRHKVGLEAMVVRGAPVARMDAAAFAECALDALLRNAITFSVAGGVVCVEIGERGDWVDVSVSNFGLGIAKERMARLFSMPAPTDGMGARESEQGFGLPLAAKAVERMGGKIRVESERLTDLGPICQTVFTVSLPSAARSGPREVESGPGLVRWPIASEEAVFGG